MAVTGINGTRNGTGAVNYVLRPKSNKRERVRAMSGNNVNLKYASEQMRMTREANGKNGLNRKTGKEFVQAYRLKQSFSDKELDPNSDADVETCNRMGLELAKEIYPDHEVLVVTHSDGLGGKLHNHLIINAVSFETGKSLRGERTKWTYVSEKSDEILKRNGLSVIDHKKGQDKKSQAEIELAERGEYVWKDDLKERIRTTLGNDEITDRDSFVEYMKDEHKVDVRFRGKGMSYAFEDEDGKKRRIRSGKLGTNFQKENIEETLEENKKIAQAEPVASPKVSRKRNLYADAMRDFVRADIEQIRADKEAQQKAENERLRAEQAQPKESQPETPKEPKRALDDKMKREKERKEKERLERQKREEMERERQRLEQEQERKRKFLKEDVKHVVPKMGVVGSDIEVVGYRNQRTNKALSEEEVAWFQECNEEQKGLDGVAPQQNITDDLER